MREPLLELQYVSAAAIAQVLRLFLPKHMIQLVFVSSEREEDRPKALMEVKSILTGTISCLEAC